ncbi:MAG: hypothetical protein ABF242_01320 [Flavobacteriales bacterium]
MKNNKPLFKFLILSFFALVIHSCVNVFRLADLRGEHFIEKNEEQKARILLTKMGTAHGIENWKGLNNYTVRFTEEFFGFAGQQLNPYKNEITSLRASYIPKKNFGRLEITSGREQGTDWGIQENKAYMVFEDELKETVDLVIRNWVPKYQSLFEFVSRIQSANSLSYLGKDTINGTSCDQIFATWNSSTPQKNVDQYVIWIDDSTHQVTKLEFTSRTVSKHANESVYFSNYNNYEGIIIPSEISFESNLKRKSILHKITIYGFEKNYTQQQALQPIEILDELE